MSSFLKGCHRDSIISFLRQICREFQRGICSRDPNECRYAHPPDNVSTDSDNHVTVCMDFIKGRCTRETCRYFHPPPHLQSQIKSSHPRAGSLHNMVSASGDYLELPKLLMAYLTSSGFNLPVLFSLNI